MKLFTALYATPEGGTGLKEFIATHFSVSQANVALFYRRKPASGDRGPEKPNDELVGAVPNTLAVSLDEKTAVVTGIAEELSEEMVEAIAKVLGLKTLDDSAELRLAVTLL